MTLPQRTVKLVILKTPPSANHYVKHWRGGHYKTDEAKTFETYVALAWREAAFVPPKAKSYEITMLLYLGAGQRLDIDNSPKTVLDSLVKCGALESDAKVSYLRIEKYRDRANPRTEVEISYL